MFYSLVLTVVCLSSVGEFLKVIPNDECSIIEVDNIKELEDDDLDLEVCLLIYINKTADIVEALNDNVLVSAPGRTVRLKIVGGLTHIEGNPFIKYNRSMDIIELQNNNLPTFKDNTFDGLILKALDLRSNNILSLGNRPFGNSVITNLDLRDNKISTITQSTFSTKVFNINLFNNSISYLQPNCFPNSLRTLDLSNNLISYINQDHFSNLENLVDLRLSHNIIGSINFFQNHLEKLNSLDLSFNDIEKLEENSFSMMKNLQTFNLRNNRITTISSSLVQELTNLNALDISLNKFSSFPFEKLPKSLKLFNIFGNPWNCKCLRNMETHIFKNNILVNSYCESKLSTKVDTPICIGTEKVDTNIAKSFMEKIANIVVLECRIQVVNRVNSQLSNIESFLKNFGKNRSLNKQKYVK